jgi:hypothetical protein
MFLEGVTLQSVSCTYITPEKLLQTRSIQYLLSIIVADGKLPGPFYSFFDYQADPTIPL